MPVAFNVVWTLAFVLVHPDGTRQTEYATGFDTGPACMAFAHTLDTTVDAVKERSRVRIERTDYTCQEDPKPLET